MAFLRAESWKRGSGLMATNYHPSIYIVCRYGVHIESRSNIPILVKEPPNLEIAILPPIRLIISFDALMWDESPRVRLYTVIIVFFFFFQCIDAKLITYDMSRINLHTSILYVSQDIERFTRTIQPWITTTKECPEPVLVYGTAPFIKADSRHILVSVMSVLIGPRIEKN